MNIIKLKHNRKKEERKIKQKYKCIIRKEIDPYAFFLLPWRTRARGQIFRNQTRNARSKARRRTMDSDVKFKRNITYMCIYNATKHVDIP